MFDNVYPHELVMICPEVGEFFNTGKIYDPRPHRAGLR